jgi:hypothetical protein
MGSDIISDYCKSISFFSMCRKTNSLSSSPAALNININSATAAGDLGPWLDGRDILDRWDAGLVV